MSGWLRLASAVLLAITAVAAGAEGTEDPRVLDTRPIMYPQQARRLEQEGTVVLRVHVLETGAAGSVVLQASSGHELLDAEALRFARTARFAPARRDGQSFATWVTLPVRFQLADGPLLK